MPSCQAWHHRPPSQRCQHWYSALSSIFPLVAGVVVVLFHIKGVVVNFQLLSCREVGNILCHTVWSLGGTMCFLTCYPFKIAKHNHHTCEVSQLNLRDVGNRFAVIITYFSISPKPSDGPEVQAHQDLHCLQLMQLHVLLWAGTVIP